MTTITPTSSVPYAPVPKAPVSPNTHTQGNQAVAPKAAADSDGDNDGSRGIDVTG